MSQLKLPGMDEVEKQWAAEQVAAEKKAHEEWAASTLRSMVERYPTTAEEWEIMLSGIRLCRFVSNLECEKCNFATEDHTEGWLFETKVCLKDYYSLRHRLGLGK
ncbi:hypothetical protein KKF82_05735 [Patescibacteria group bacterium]|nr:hypothetical protein [Patescibacteria group bacterium]